MVETEAGEGTSFFRLTKTYPISEPFILKSIGKLRMVNLAEGAIKTVEGEIPAS